MKGLGLDRYALSGCAAAALLAGCGGSQPPIGAPAAMPQSATQQSLTAQRNAIAAQRDAGASWMLPGANSEDLLYISNAIYTKGNSQVLVFSYPNGKRVGVLTGFSEPVGECVDEKGDVFITNTAASGAGYVYEYAHGGSSPIAVLGDPLTYPESCSVDPKSGKLAVVSVGGVAVYPQAQGTPTTYTDSSFGSMNYGGYDGQGNLFVDGWRESIGFVFAELPRGSSSFTNLSVNKPCHDDGSVQWDGQYITLQTVAQGGFAPRVIYRLTVSGSVATVVGTTKLETTRNRYDGGQFWIQGKNVIGPKDSGEAVAFWKYPAGGKGIKTINNVGSEAWGVTVSLAAGAKPRSMHNAKEQGR
jgi:hypothetical protein